MVVYLLAGLLFGIGLYGVLVKRNLIKIIIGLSIMEYALFLLFALIGYRKDAVAPIITKFTDKATLFVDSLPQALVLTAIVIGLGTTALIVSLAVRIYEKYGTFDITRLRKLRG